MRRAETSPARNGDTRQTRIVLVDDHRMFRNALRTMLECDPCLAVVGEASDGRELMDVAKATSPDVVCMDIGMPHMNGVEATRRLVSLNSSIKVIGLSSQSDRSVIVDMIRSGAVGYVTKGETGDELVRAIRAVMGNKKYLCAEVAAALTDTLNERTGDIPKMVRLASRERQVLQLVAEGYTSTQIAERLFVAVSTVEVHRRNIMKKLNLHGVAELTKYAIRHGITSVES